MNIDIDSIREGGSLYTACMTPELFEKTNYFKNYWREKWGDYRLVRVPLVYWLDKLRSMAHTKLRLHCVYEERDHGYHPKGMAADFHLEGMSVLDQFLLASRLPFKGMGLYPYWNQRGLHADLRPRDIRYDWFRDAHGNYHQFTNMRQVTSSVWHEAS